MRKSITEVVCDVCFYKTRDIIAEAAIENPWYEYMIADKLIDVCPHCKSLLDRMIWLGIASKGLIKEA